MPLPVLITAYKDKTFEFVRGGHITPCLFSAGTSSPPLNARRPSRIRQPLISSRRQQVWRASIDTECHMALPPADISLRCAQGIVTGAHKPGHQKRGTMSLKHVYEIAKARQ